MRNRIFVLLGLFSSVLASLVYAANLASSATLTLIDSEHNNTTWAAANIHDENTATRWLSSKQSNNLNFIFNASKDLACVKSVDLTNYGVDDRSISSFMLFHTDNDALSADSGTAGWTPIIADATPVGTQNGLAWANGGRISSIDAEHNDTTWAAANMIDGDIVSRWLSPKQNNTLQFAFDTDWDDANDDAINISSLKLYNYGTDDRSVKLFQVEVTTDGSTWSKLEVPGTGSGDDGFNYTLAGNGGAITAIDAEHNNTTWAAANIHDGDSISRWLSSKSNNTLDFKFDPENDGTFGVDSDTGDYFTIEKIYLKNYGADDRAVNEFQVEYKSTVKTEWTKLEVPGTAAGDADFNYSLTANGASLSAIDSEHNDTTWAAANIHDGDKNSRWLSSSQSNTLDFVFDPDADATTGAAGDTGDYFTINKIYIKNYGVDDRSVKEFQVEVKTSVDGDWRKLQVPAALASSDDYNFMLVSQGGAITAIDSEHNDTTWAAANIHDGSDSSRWLSSKQSNTLDFSFDPDNDGTKGSAGDADDLFTIQKIYLKNYGVDDRSVKEFQVEVKTSANGSWTKLEVPGSTAGEADFNYSITPQGGEISAFSSQHNDSTWAAANIHDGSGTTRWLSSSQSNTLDFEFDPDNSGTTGFDGDSDDLFTIHKIYLKNYGDDDRSVKEFQVEVKTSANADWTKLEVPGSTGGEADYNFTVTSQGGQLSAFSSQHNDSTWAAANINDGSGSSRWLSQSQGNTLDFVFDPDNDSTTGLAGDTGDRFTLEKIYLQNYGADDRSVKEFQVEVKTAANANWTKLEVPGSTAGAADFNYTVVTQGGTMTAFSSQHNDSTWAAANIHDGSGTSRWLSTSQSNTLDFEFDPDNDATSGLGGDAGDQFTLEKVYLQNYGVDDRSIKEFQIEVKTSANANWAKIEVPGATAGAADYNYSLDSQGGILTAFSAQHNDSTWAAANIHDGSGASRWLSTSQSNTLDFEFDPDEDSTSGLGGDAGDVFDLQKIYLQNYGADDRSIKEFQIEVKTSANANWTKIEVPGATAGAADYNFALDSQGGTLTAFSSQHNDSTWAAANINDGSGTSRWLSSSQSNTLDFAFDPDGNSTTGLAGDTGDQFTLEKIYLQNYGADDRAIKNFQIEVKTSANANWTKIEVPGATAGEADYNFALASQGGTLTAFSSQHNDSTWAAANIHDGSGPTRWLSQSQSNTLDFAFDADEDGTTGTGGDSDDLFTLQKFYIQNYGADDRSIKDFQVEVKTSANGNWTKLEVPGATAGAADYNFALNSQGGIISAYSSQHNSTTWAAANINDGSSASRWLARFGNSTVDFEFDPDNSGTSGLGGDTGDRFKLEKIYLQNYGADDRAIKQFQVEVKTSTDSDWTKLEVPGSSSGEANYNFVMSPNGGAVTSYTRQHNSTTWAAANSNDGNNNTRWLGHATPNTIEYAFDTNYDGSTGDKIKIDKIQLVNYGVDDRSVATFSIEVKINNGNWKYVDAPGGGTTFTAAMDETLQSWTVDSMNNVKAARITTLTNHGDPSYTGFREIIFSGNSMKPSRTFTAAMNGNGETFTLDNGDRPNSVTAVRLRAINNYGDPSYYGVAEFRVLADSVTPSTTFTAAMNGDGETFTLDVADRPTNVKEVRLRTISNYGDPSYIGAAEFRAMGPSVTVSKTFTAAMNGDGETFTIDEADRPENVKAVRLRTVSNYGDPSYTGAAEFRVMGPSVTASTTFTAAMNGDGETFTIDVADRPTNVKAVRLRTISNYGDPSYTGAAEFRVMGPSVTASKTFTAAMDGTGETFTIDEADRPTGVKAVRLRTISNYGDPSYIGAAEFRVLGPSVTPSNTFTAAMNGSGETFTLDEADRPTKVTSVRFRTVTNYGDPSYTGAAEFRVLGPSVLPSTTFTAAMTGNGETFTLDEADRPANVKAVRLRTVSNYGDPSYTGVAEFYVLGPSVTPSNTFTAAMDGSGETFTLDEADRPTGVKEVRFRSISNYGDPSYTGAAEFKVLGPTVTPSTTFTAAMNATGETFTLDVEDRPANVKEVRFRTISNYGDPSYTGAAEFRVLGDSVTPGYTFEAAMNGDGETFTLDVADRPENITAVRFKTISNWGDPTYTGAAEFRVLGPAVTASYNFTSPMTKGPHEYTLDEADRKTGVKGVKFITIENHGDPSYTGIAELELVGASSAPSYEFKPTMDATLQSFSFDQVEAKVFRFHTLANHGDPSYTGAKELAINGELGNCSTSCALGSFVITQPSSGLACPTDRAAITIKAMCADGVTTKTDYTGTVTLSGDANSEFYEALTGGSAVTQSTFAVGESGVKTAYLYQKNVTSSLAVTVNDTAASVSTSASSGTAFGAAEIQITTQPSNMICGQTTSLTMQVYGQTSGGSCGVLTDFTGDQDFKAWFDADLDTAVGYDKTGTDLTIVNNGNSTDIDDAGQPGSNNLVLSFSSGVTTATISHADAAQIAAIRFRHDDDPYDGTPFSAMTVDTNAFVVRPKSLKMKAEVWSPSLNKFVEETNWYAANSLDTKFKKAGEDFGVTVQAICSNGATAKHYLSQSDITLSHTVNQPVGGVSGSLKTLKTKVDSGATDGVMPVSQSITEVGIFDLSATLPANSYFSQTIGSAELKNVGRFVPSILAFSLPNSPITQACTTGTDYTYLDGSFGSSFILTARNTGGTVTTNYEDSFAKLTNSLGTLNYKAIDSGGPTLLSGRLSASSTSVSWTDGVGSISSTLSLARATSGLNQVADGPYASTTIGVIPADSDGVTVPSFDLDTSNNGSTDSMSLGQGAFRFGRLVVNSSFGPDTTTLSAPLTVEYWDGSFYRINTDDSCTQIAEGVFSFVNLQGDISAVGSNLSGGSSDKPKGTYSVSGNQVEFTLGFSPLEFSAPNKTGSFGISVDLSAYPYLRYDWDQDGDSSDDTTAGGTITFGLRRGNDRVIQVQEVF